MIRNRYSNSSRFNNAASEYAVMRQASHKRSTCTDGIAHPAPMRTRSRSLVVLLCILVVDLASTAVLFTYVVLLSSSIYFGACIFIFCSDHGNRVHSAVVVRYYIHLHTNVHKWPKSASSRPFTYNSTYIYIVMIHASLRVQQLYIHSQMQTRIQI